MGSLAADDAATPYEWSRWSLVRSVPKQGVLGLGIDCVASDRRYESLTGGVEDGMLLHVLAQRFQSVDRCGTKACTGRPGFPGCADEANGFIPAAEWQSFRPHLLDGFVGGRCLSITDTEQQRDLSQSPESCLRCRRQNLSGIECFDACSKGWGYYAGEQLPHLIAATTVPA